LNENIISLSISPLIDSAEEIEEEVNKHRLPI